MRHAALIKLSGYLFLIGAWISLIASGWIITDAIEVRIATKTDLESLQGELNRGYFSLALAVLLLIGHWASLRWLNRIRK